MSVELLDCLGRRYPPHLARQGSGGVAVGGDVQEREELLLQGIDTAEIIDAVHHRPAPVIPASAGPARPVTG